MYSPLLSMPGHCCIAAAHVAQLLQYRGPIERMQKLQDCSVAVQEVGSYLGDCIWRQGVESGFAPGEALPEMAEAAPLSFYLDEVMDKQYLITPPAHTNKVLIHSLSLLIAPPATAK